MITNNFIKYYSNIKKPQEINFLWFLIFYMVGNAGLEPATPRSQSACATNCANFRWWVYLELNQGPHDYQSCALTNWAIHPNAILEMERAMRLELTTLCLEGRCSSQLSYARICLSLQTCETHNIKISNKVKTFFTLFYYYKKNPFLKGFLINYFVVLLL